MKKILICSGKGGVGKTTISVLLSETLSKMGNRVALVDGDIDTPNVPEFAGIHQEIGIGEKIKPVIRDNLEIVSLGFILKETDFVLWPSEKRAMAVQQLVEAVDWNSNNEYMIIDSPPGTSDEIEFIAEVFKPSMIFIVSTPHEASISDVKRTISMLHKFKSNIAGIIMNMSEIKCKSCGEVVYKPSIPADISGVDIIHEIEYSVDDIDIGKIAQMILED